MNLPLVIFFFLSSTASLSSSSSSATRGRRQTPSPGPTQERLISEADVESIDDGDLRIEAEPSAPYWLKPVMMERQVYAEVLNSQVRFRSLVVKGSNPE